MVDNILLPFFLLDATPRTTDGPPLVSWPCLVVVVVVVVWLTTIPMVITLDNNRRRQHHYYSPHWTLLLLPNVTRQKL